jgi:hypothetical protein
MKMDQELRDILQHAHDEVTSFLLDNVSDDENWEDAFPMLDALRDVLGDLLAAEYVQ